MSEKTMFPREDHTEMLFQKILNDPWACDRLMETFNENLVYNDEFDVSLPAEKFAKALFNAYTNRDLSALLMCLCNNTVFDLLRNSYIIPYRFNADGHQNPIIMTDEHGNPLPEYKHYLTTRTIYIFTKYTTICQTKRISTMHRLTATVTHMIPSI